ncbi:MAG: hypothetical protein IJW51_06265 [Clostridia bacterium]|nr:hypothetical protein [Clostridia bacterium]
MTLTEMRPNDTGVLLAVPSCPLVPQLRAGTHVRCIEKRDDLISIEADGVRFVLALSLAAQMILAAYL